MLIQLSILQKYLPTLFNRGEINKMSSRKCALTMKKLPVSMPYQKSTKNIQISLPKFHSIIDTTLSCYNKVGSFFTQLLNLLSQNNFVIKDFFDAANKIREIPTDLFNKAYVFASSDIESFFTNAPLERNINIILDHVYNKNLATTPLKKRTLKKPFKDTCSKMISAECN